MNCAMPGRRYNEFARSFGARGLSLSFCDNPLENLLERLSRDSASANCSDDNPATHVDAVEVCDGVDNDCDGRTDEGLGCDE